MMKTTTRISIIVAAGTALILLGWLALSLPVVQLWLEPDAVVSSWAHQNEYDRLLKTLRSPFAPRQAKRVALLALSQGGSPRPLSNPELLRFSDVCNVPKDKLTVLFQPAPGGELNPELVKMVLDANLGDSARSDAYVVLTCADPPPDGFVKQMEDIWSRIKPENVKEDIRKSVVLLQDRGHSPKVLFQHDGEEMANTKVAPIN